MSLFPLRPHQERALTLLRQSIGSGRRRPMLCLPTGSGKTVIAAHIMHGAMAKRKRAGFVVPALSLIDQTFDRFVQNGIEPGDIGVIQGDHNWRRPQAPIQIASVQTLRRRGMPDFGLLVVDEAHVRDQWLHDYLTGPEGASVPAIGLSATPWAAGLGNIYDDLIRPVSMRELIDQGLLSKFRVFAPSHPDLVGVKTVAGDYHEGQLAERMSKPQIVADIVSTWMEKAKDLPTLCFCVNRAHARLVHDQFEREGVSVAYVDAKTPREERDEIGKRLAAGDVQVVCNIGCLTTGIDWDVRCIILARPTKSDMLFCLDTETEILTSAGWRGMGQINVGDCVASCEGTNPQAGRWSKVLAVVERDMRENENWVEYDAPRANFRVTNKHRMIFEGAHESSGFRVGEANEMVACKGGAKLPTAVHLSQAGVPLSEAELYFIGMMMTDGTWTDTKGSISQSERHPSIIERIESSLQACGIGYAKRRAAPPPHDAVVSERHARWVFAFSAGKPKPHKRLGREAFGHAVREPYVFVPGITGYRHLMPFMDKDFAPALMQMSKSQLRSLLSGIWDGDGSKKVNVDYAPQTIEICSARKTMLDRLQALCAINGMTANLRVECGKSRKNPMYFLSITDKDWRHCGGYASKSGNPRPQIEMKPATSERVWCVETEAGTIVTRRRGKVTVMGNCQIIGRGLRTAEGKDHCIILDHSDTHLRLGMVDEIDHHELSTGKPKSVSKSGEEKEQRLPLPLECDACGCLVAAGHYECQNCNHQIRRRVAVDHVEGELQELLRGGKRKAAPSISERLVAKGKQRVWLELLSFADEKRRSRGYASHAYRELFGVWPRGLEEHFLGVWPSADLRAYLKAKDIRFAKSRARETGAFLKSVPTAIREFLHTK